MLRGPEKLRRQLLVSSRKSLKRTRTLMRVRLMPGDGAPDKEREGGSFERSAGLREMTDVAGCIGDDEFACMKEQCECA